MSENDRRTKRYADRLPRGATNPSGRKTSDSEIKILRDIAADLLLLREQTRQNNIVIMARFDALAAELGDLKRQVSATNLLAGDALKKTTDLHTLFIGNANEFGGRLLNLERRIGTRPTRPPRRG